MTKRELIKDIMSRRNTSRCGFWMGNPDKETVRIYMEAAGVDSPAALGEYFGDDIRWITPHYAKSTYRHPEGKSMRPWKAMNPYGMSGGPLSSASKISDLDVVDWPDTQWLDFSETLETLRNAGDCYRLSGFWSPFFHDLTYLFGTEELLIKMYTEPELINEVMERLCGFYYKANEMFFAEAGDMVDGVFFGNDFGTQNDLLITPDQFEAFYLPWIKKFADQAHAHGYHCVLHSCGSIYRIIDQLIDAGVDCIHPIQALAANMDADSLSVFKGRIAFMGGVDTQHVLPDRTPEEVRAETLRVMKTLGPNIVVGPSHEVLMPNVPFANAKAMAEAAHSENIQIL